MTIRPDDPRHGTATGYQNHHCRCPECKEAWVQYQRAYRARKAGTLAGDDPRHGTMTGYHTFRCRCAACVAFNADRARRYRRSIATPSNGGPS